MTYEVDTIKADKQELPLHVWHVGEDGKRRYMSILSMPPDVQPPTIGQRIKVEVTYEPLV
jgi:hypothetical protein